MSHQSDGNDTGQVWFDKLTMTCTQLTIVVTLGNNRLDPHGLVFYGDSVDQKSKKLLTLLE